MFPSCRAVHRAVREILSPVSSLFFLEEEEKTQIEKGHVGGSSNGGGGLRCLPFSLSLSLLLRRRGQETERGNRETTDTADSVLASFLFPARRRRCLSLVPFLPSRNYRGHVISLFFSLEPEGNKREKEKRPNVMPAVDRLLFPVVSLAQR